MPNTGRVMRASGWKEREVAFCGAAVEAGRIHRRFGISDDLEPAAGPFHSQPYRVPNADSFAAALRAAIADPPSSHGRPSARLIK